MKEIEGRRWTMGRVWERERLPASRGRVGPNIVYEGQLPPRPRSPPPGCVQDGARRGERERDRGGEETRDRGEGRARETVRRKKRERKRETEVC